VSTAADAGSLPSLLARLEAAARRRAPSDIDELVRAPALLRRLLLDHPESGAGDAASDAAWYEHAFLTAELETVSAEAGRVAATRGEPAGAAEEAAAALVRALARVAAVLEVRALREPAGRNPDAGAAEEPGAADPESAGHTPDGGAPAGQRPPGTTPASPLNSHGTRSLAPEEIDALLRRNNWGVLATSLDDEPYGVPIIYGWDGEGLYFVTGPGRKADFMEANPAVTLTVTEVEDGGARWRSVIVRGEARRLTGVGERLRALGALRRQRPGTRRRSAKDAARLARARFIEIRTAELTGRSLGF
jgi:nitroimidazol reductase NimA-like FMN-containing flavoprotein (pyridoxamine 5'-phosphate oxidase superfamily)